MAKICNICCETYNKSLNSKVTCNYDTCNFEACKKCIRTYLMGTPSNAHCMNCKNPWDTEFIVENLNKSFVYNEYKEHRKKLLTEKEISRTSELMSKVEDKKTIDVIDEEINIMKKKHLELKKLEDDMRKKILEKSRMKHRIMNGNHESKERKKFIMPCPGDNCKGYLSTQYKCGICNLYTCPDCFEIIGYEKTDEHICKEDNIKSAESIKKDTKPCPSCGVRIHKISGCDQMWCTECKVAFSWNSGNIITTQNIHNPHYYNYMRENNMNGVAPRNPGDILCGGLINFANYNFMMRNLQVHNCNYSLRDNNPDLYNKLLNYIDTNVFDCRYISLTDVNSLLREIHRNSNHITYNDLEIMRRKIRNNVNNDDITISYILDKITKEELGNLILKRDNSRKINQDILNIYEILSVTSIERFNNIYSYWFDNKKTLESMTYGKTNSSLNHSPILIKLYDMLLEFILDYFNLIDYCNKQFIHISIVNNITMSIIQLSTPKKSLQFDYKITSLLIVNISIKFSKSMVANSASNISSMCINYLAPKKTKEKEKVKATTTTANEGSSASHAAM